MPYFIKMPVKGFQMLLRRIFGSMGPGVEQHHFHLQGCVAHKAQKLGLGSNFCRHEVHDGDPEGTDVLMDSPVLIHGKDVLPV